TPDTSMGTDQTTIDLHVSRTPTRHAHWVYARLGARPVRPHRAVRRAQRSLVGEHAARCSRYRCDCSILYQRLPAQPPPAFRGAKWVASDERRSGFHTLVIVHLHRYA